MTGGLRIHYTTTSDGISIACSEAGQGPAILSCGATPFTHVQETFVSSEAYYAALTHSFRVITFDARGTGMSDRDAESVSNSTLMMDTEAVILAAKLDRFLVHANAGNLLSLLTCLRISGTLS